jgi:hypothetical protein
MQGLQLSSHQPAGVSVNFTDSASLHVVGAGAAVNLGTLASQSLVTQLVTLAAPGKVQQGSGQAVGYTHPAGGQGRSLEAGVATLFTPAHGASGYR